MTESINGGDRTQQATHYCDDCEGELIIVYDDRGDRDVPLVCGNCGGTNTRELEEPREVSA